MIGGIVAGLNHAMHSVGDNDDEYMLTKDRKTVKVGTKGGDTIARKLWTISTQSLQREKPKKLGDEIERILSVIIHNPSVFPLSDKGKVRKATILKYNAMYYRIVENEIQILSFFSNRQNPDAQKI